MDRKESWEKKTKPELQTAAMDCFKLGAKIRAIGGYAKSLKSEREFVAQSERAADHLEAAAQILNTYLEQRSGSGPSGLVAGCVNRLIRGISKSDEEQEEKNDESKEFSGHSRAISIPEVLEFLSFYQKTGFLNIATEDENFTLELERGEVIHAASDNTPPGLRLGEVLVRQGAISPDQLQQHLTKSRNKQRLGKALQEGEMISTDALRKALETQVQQLFVRLFSSEEAYFVFREGKSATDNDGRLRMNVTSLLLESASSVDEDSVQQEERDRQQPAA